MEEIRDYYSKLAPEYDRDRFGNTYGRYIHRQEEAHLSRYLRSGKTLNLGCGTGRFMELADEGLDISDAMIREARQKFPGKTFTVSDASAVPYSNGSFDQIFSLHVVMHLPPHETAGLISEAARTLTEGGNLIFDFPSARRRRLLRRKQDGWHGASAYTISEIQKIAGDGWKLVSYAGILFLPIHRMPKWSRSFFIGMDSLLCRSFLKQYASYLIVKFEKQ